MLTNSPISAIEAGDRFTNVENFLTIIRFASIIGVISIGMTFVITAGGIDLSVGSVMGLATVVGAVRAHGGAFGAGNRDGAGARFWFKVPVDRPDPSDVASMSPSKAEPLPDIVTDRIRIHTPRPANPTQGH